MRFLEELKEIAKMDSKCEASRITHWQKLIELSGSGT